MASSHAGEVQTVHAFTRSVTTTIGYKYLLALPAGYNPRDEKRWPLLLFLHGSSERGDDVWTVATHGPPKLLRAEKRSAAAQQLRKFIVLSPQCPKGRWWDAQTLLALLDEIVATHGVDETRVYVAGISMGGYGTWELGLLRPDRFAAILPVAGGGSFAPIFRSNIHRRKALRSLGVWAFHGAKDETVPVAESERLVDFLKTMKVDDVRLTVYPESEHDSWSQTFSKPEIYEWLLGHRRRPSDTRK